MAFVDLNEAVISQVRQSADIVDFVSQVTPLKVTGARHKGLCPFHREKTPSFNVDRAKGLFYCFGCGTGGDVFKFLMLTERLTFPEAVEHVATRTGITLPKKQKSQREAGKEDLFGVMEDAAEAFHQALEWIPNAAEQYLTRRGVTPDIWSKYGFGYAPDTWDYILTRLGRKHGPKKIEAAGLVIPKKSGDGFYDRFRNRLLVPIHSEAGTLVGFGGRTLDGSDPKYLNSPESVIFNKSNLLYNLHRAKEAIRRFERAILVEGYFDCITVDHSGVAGVVASMGTSLTPGQASLLRKSTKRVLIAYDGDDAGRNATLRAAPVLLSAGLQVEVVDVGSGNDPDTLIRKGGADAFVEAIGLAQDVFTFALERRAPNPAGMSSQQKNETLEALLPLMSSIADPVSRNDAAQRIADRLRLTFETVWSRMRRDGRDIRSERSLAAPISTGEKQLMMAMLQEGADRSLLGSLKEELFEDEGCRAIFRVVAKLSIEGKPLDFSEIATHLRGEAELTRLSELALGEEGGERVDPHSLESTIRLMERRYLDRRLKDIQHAIQEANREGDHSREETLLVEKSEVSRRLHALK